MHIAAAFSGHAHGLLLLTLLCPSTAPSESSDSADTTLCRYGMWHIHSDSQEIKFVLLWPSQLQKQEPL